VRRRLGARAEGRSRCVEDVHAWLDGARAALVQTPVCAVKTLAAYRASLRLRTPSDADLEAGFAALRRQPQPRINGDPLCHALLFQAAEECARLGLPLQVHCGLGDPDEDLAEASPLGLRPLFTEPRFEGLKVV